jgi:hypothetical protein
LARRIPCGPAPRTRRPSKDEHVKELKQKIGELVLYVDILKEAAKQRSLPRRVQCVRE